MGFVMVIAFPRGISGSKRSAGTTSIPQLGDIFLASSPSHIAAVALSFYVQRNGASAGILRRDPICLGLRHGAVGLKSTWNVPFSLLDDIDSRSLHGDSSVARWSEVHIFTRYRFARTQFWSH